MHRKRPNRREAGTRSFVAGVVVAAVIVGFAAVIGGCSGPTAPSPRQMAMCMLQSQHPANWTGGMPAPGTGISPEEMASAMTMQPVIKAGRTMGLSEESVLLGLERLRTDQTYSDAVKREFVGLLKEEMVRSQQ